MMNETLALLEPVCHAVDVALPVDDAFALFTSGLARWWPLGSHSCSRDRGAAVRFGAGVGAQVVEVAPDGRTHPWGSVTRWEPPHGFTMSWHPGQDAAQATRLEVRFEPTASGCRVDIRHDGWAARGAKAAEVRGHYERGWVHVLGCFADGAAARR
jgi:hypothetical protein